MRRVHISEACEAIAPASASIAVMRIFMRKIITFAALRGKPFLLKERKGGTAARDGRWAGKTQEVNPPNSESRPVVKAQLGVHKAQSVANQFIRSSLRRLLDERSEGFASLSLLEPESHESQLSIGGSLAGGAELLCLPCGG